MPKEEQMLQIGDTLISLELLNEHFICDLPLCMGSCCIEGESGAPLEPDEKQRLEDLLPVVWDDLSLEAKALIKMQGVSFIDIDDDLVTSIVNGKACVFTYFDEKGICKCAIEKAYSDGKTDFKKPVSCHLYPVRTTKYPTFTAVNYNQWHICEPARILGKKEGLPVYQFLKEPLIRKFGKAWFDELELAADELRKQSPMD